jgi:hypothetical protein
LTDAVVAHLINLTGLVVEADILAELAVTDLPLRALCVAGTGGRLADTAHHGGGVGDEGGRTGALGPVIHYLAPRVRAARLAGARIHTPGNKPQ